jgi:hypothetical protein
LNEVKKGKEFEMLWVAAVMLKKMMKIICS